MWHVRTRVAARSIKSKHSLVKARQCILRRRSNVWTQNALMHAQSNAFFTGPHPRSKKTANTERGTASDGTGNAELRMRPARKKGKDYVLQAIMGCPEITILLSGSKNSAPQFQRIRCVQHARDTFKLHCQPEKGTRVKDPESRTRLRCPTGSDRECGAIQVHGRSPTEIARTFVEGEER